MEDPREPSRLAAKVDARAWSVRSGLRHRAWTLIAHGLDVFDVNAARTSFMVQLKIIDDLKPESLPEFILVVCIEAIPNGAGLSDCGHTVRGSGFRDGHVRMYEHIRNCFAHAIERRRGLQAEP
jgi:hypothetical protein